MCTQPFLKIDVPGDRARLFVNTSCDLDLMLRFERGDVVLIEPHRNFYRNRDAVIGKHESPQGLVPQFVVAYGWYDWCGRLRRGVLLLIDNDPRYVSPGWRRLRRTRFGIVIVAEQLVRAGRRKTLQEIGNCREMCITEPLVVERS
jgi:hypothetical protein